MGNVFVRSIQLRHLRCLVAIAQEQHLARAAERLALSQPAVSKTLAELEALAGQRLVERGRRGARLTPAGERLLEHALRVEQTLSQADQALRPDQGQRLQRWRIGALPSVAPAWLPQLLVWLQRQHPQLQIQVQTQTNTALLQALQRGELDMVLGRMADPALMAGLSFELLGAEPLALLVRAGHPLAQAPKPALSEVLAWPALVYAEGTIPRHSTESFLSSRGLSLPAGRVETLSVSLARRLTLESNAVWFSPPGAAGDDVAQGRMVWLDVPTRGSEEPVGILLRSEAPDRSDLREAVRAQLRGWARQRSAQG